MSNPATSMFITSPDIQKARESILGDDTDKKEEAVAKGTVEVEYASGLKLAAVVAALVLSVFLVSLDLTIVATAILKITNVSLHIHSSRTAGADYFLGFQVSEFCIVNWFSILPDHRCLPIYVG